MAPSTASPNPIIASSWVEELNQTLKEANDRRYHCDSHQQLRQHLDAYNFAKLQESSSRRTLDEVVCKTSADEPVPL